MSEEKTRKSVVLNGLSSTHQALLDLQMKCFNKGVTRFEPREKKTSRPKVRLAIPERELVDSK